MIGMRVVGTGAAAAQLTAMAAAVSTAVGQVVASQGEELQRAIQAAASGRPGPNVISGQFRSGITLDVDRTVGHATATASSTAPQAFRLEFGFYGVDSIGRRYSAPPYPSFGPGFDAVAPGFPTAVIAAVRAVL